ncbi:unnamed protein product [Blepharisma stoltei]|uniref:Uncharacterized protein n=1 Tax=Blepharisma stoltei TaxID=1481888 RepID=A0AAU9IZ71_9CILI|nr:unnamed protein product [Blepharisma stoltei]
MQNHIQDKKSIHFCEKPKPEDLSNLKYKTFKELIANVSPLKKIDLCEYETFTRKQELDIDYWKHNQNLIETVSSIDSQEPVITEECLNNWVKQSLNLKYKRLPQCRPFLMAPKIYSFLKEVECKRYGRRAIFRSESARRVKTLEEINKEFYRPKVSVKKLKAVHIEGQKYVSPINNRRNTVIAESMTSASISPLRTMKTSVSTKNMQSTKSKVTFSRYPSQGRLTRSRERNKVLEK